MPTGHLPNLNPLHRPSAGAGNLPRAHQSGCGFGGIGRGGLRGIGRGRGRSPGHRSQRNGFTLAELLTVITIIVIASLISIPSLIYMFKNSATTQATVQLQAALAQARALAITTHAPAAAIFYEDPGFTEQSAVFFASAMPGQPDPASGVLPTAFMTDTNIQPRFFPKGIYVAGYVGPYGTHQISSSAGVPTGYIFPSPIALGTNVGLSTSDPLRAVIFMPNGRTVICPAFSVLNVPDDATTAPLASVTAQGPSCIGLSIFQTTGLPAADLVSQAALGSYLAPNQPPAQPTVPLYIVNTYTGTLSGGVAP